jgi:hypothetical protein
MKQKKALCDLNTNDWKTAMARPEDYPTIPKGTVVEYLGDMTNYYGRWAQIKGSTGYTYYIDPRNLEDVT